MTAHDTNPTTTDATTPDATGVEVPHDTDTEPAGTDWQAEAKKWEKRSKANHATVRDLEARFASFQTAISQALGLADTTDDPAALTEQLSAERAIALGITSAVHSAIAVRGA